MVIVAWFSVLLITATITMMGRKMKILPIICQLVFIMLTMPLIHYYIFPLIQINHNDFFDNKFIKFFYSINFTLLFSYILSDIVDVKLDLKIIKIALPSFFIPFIIGLLLAFYVLKENNLISIISLGLICSITAIPVLYLYLKNMNYNLISSKKLIQSAVIMDIFCWTIFSITKESTNIKLMLIAIGIGMIPLLLKYIFKIKSETIYSSLFFIIMLILDYYKLNILVFGITYLMILSSSKIKFKLPFSDNWFKQYQNFVAIPFIIIFGVTQINFETITNYSLCILSILIIIPILAKTLGNWLGLIWANKKSSLKEIWIESILLNTRGLTEIVFLNMLFQQKIINQQVYLTMMIMGIISTLIAGVYANYLYKINLMKN